MAKTTSKNTYQRDRWAVSLSFAASILLAIEALHPGSCAWMNMPADQCFALSAGLSTVTMFLGTFILTKLLRQQG